ncbi:MAG: GNAT family N-acetyltransferase [Hyphomonadaceae bacterium]|nr:GNAT family N-acetyltransferase [Hyphomonadaceae bacterium]
MYDTFESTWLSNITSDAAKAFRDEDRPAAYVARRGHEFWVCECGNCIVGFVDWQGDFVNALHVRSSYARSGAGTQLMDKAEAEIRNSGFSAARLETDTFNTISRAFYAKRGYMETGRYPDTEWSSDLVTILLVKALQ